MDEVVEELVDGVVRSIAGWDPTSRQRQDGGMDAELTVDFTYTDPSPGIALEITGLYRSEDLAATPEGTKLGARLSEYAVDERWGTWFVSVKTYAQMRLVEPEIANIIRELIAADQTEVWPGYYTVADLEDAERAWGRRGMAIHMEEHERTKNLGIVSVKRMAETEDVVLVVPVGDADIAGFSDPLNEAIGGNAEKLGKARPRETHLAVLVDRFDALRDPGATPVPAIPDEIDVLWVLHKWSLSPFPVPCLWSASRGDAEWSLYDIDDPFERIVV